MNRMKKVLTLSLAILLATSLGSPWAAHGGAFVFSGEANGIDVVTHPTPYTGTGGVVTVGVCIDPTSPNAAAMEVSVQNIVALYNQLQATTGNVQVGAGSGVPPGSPDFESVALHEVGHCIGMAHPNLASESGLGDPQANGTKSTDGANNVFNVNPGPDGIFGSSDDVRGDDVNLHWYNTATNNPFTIATPVDSTTYARDLASLPAGHSFAANGDRSLSTALGLPLTEAVMQQGTFAGEAQRTLTHDDVATLSYGMSGIDELAGTGDDYTLQLAYQGLTTGCDVVLDFDNSQTGFAVCQTGGVFLGGGHVRITSANVFFNTGFNWFFNQVPFNNPPVAANDSYTTPQGTPLVIAAPGVLGNDSDPDADPLTAVPVGGAGNGTAVLNADGSFTYTPNAGFFGTDSFTYMANDGQANSNVATVTISVTQQPLTITAWRSVRKHQVISYQSIVLDPADNASTVEPRFANYDRIEVDFNQPVSLVGGGASVVVTDGSTNFTPSAITVVGGSTLRLDFFAGALPNNQCYKMDVSGSVSASGVGISGDTIAKMTKIVGDADQNQTTNLADYQLMLSLFGQSAAGNIEVDIDLSGVIDQADIRLLRRNFGISLNCN